MKWDGVVYVMKRKGGYWNAVKKKEIKGKTISDWTKHFPQLGDEDKKKFPHKSAGNKYWDFLEENGTEVKKLEEKELSYRYGRWK